jgi:predicted metal-dependent hydrolase
MSRKSAKIAALIEQCRGHELPAQYLGYFECFNRQLFYEAHDVLEELWLAEGRNAANYGFYKGLIQFAGAFVHLQKKRRGPAVALFKLSRSYLEQYSSPHQRLDVQRVLILAAEWIGTVEDPASREEVLNEKPPPVLILESSS